MCKVRVCDRVGERLCACIWPCLCVRECVIVWLWRELGSSLNGGDGETRCGVGTQSLPSSFRAFSHSFLHSLLPSLTAPVFVRAWTTSYQASPSLRPGFLLPDWLRLSRRADSHLVEHMEGDAAPDATPDMEMDDVRISPRLERLLQDDSWVNDAT